MIPGLGAGIKPPLCDVSLIDQYVFVDDLECLIGCRRMMAREAVLVGGSSGGVLTAVEKCRGQIPPGAVCAVILADRGERYLDTLFSDAWARTLWRCRKPLARGGEEALLRRFTPKEINVTESSAPSLKSPGSFQRRAVTVTSENLVRFGSLPIGELPLLAEPAAPGVSLASWAARRGGVPWHTRGTVEDEER